MTVDENQQALQELLPWLANDTLQGAERKRAVNHSNENLEGRRALRQWQALAEHMPNESYDRQGEDLAWARLNRALDREIGNSQSDQRIDADPDTGDSTIAQLNIPASDRSRRDQTSRWAQPITRGQLAASFAAIAAIGLIVALTLTPQPHPSQSFTTLSTSETSALASDEVALRLALVPSAELTVGSDAFELFLIARDASLMSHSAQAGVVTIRVDKESPFSDPAHWQQEAAILFAEQVK